MKYKLLSIFIFCFLTQNILGQSVSISPSSGEQNSSFGVTITGTGTTWSSSHCVEFSDGISSFSFVGTASSASSITGTLSIPSGANVSANYDITVYNDINGVCSGLSDGTCTNCFEVEMAPTVSISPSSGEQNSSFGVIITGTGTTWSGSHCVGFTDGISTFSFVGTASSATTITGALSIPSGANVSANYDITVYDDTNGACGGASDGTCIDCFEVEMPPAAVSISPSSGDPNTTFGVTVTGVGTTWSSSHCVEFSDGVSTFTFVGTASSATTITGTLSIPFGANVSANYDITVYDDTNGACGGASDGTCIDCFEVDTPPQTVSISPSSGEQNSSFAVTLTGIGTTWSSSHCVEFSDGVSTFTFVGTATAASTITGTLSIPPGANISADYDIAVYNATNGACSGSLDGLCTDCFEVMIDPALPLELISFTADAIDAKAKLQWKIANPQNVEGYEIHRGVEDQQTGNLKWEIIDFVAHSDSKYIYDFVDETPADGINYYRLKIVDWDEYFEWSPIVSLTFSNREVNLINLFPNPVNPSETLFMSVKTKVSTDIELTIINQSGQIINQSSWKSENQQQLYPIELGQIPGGYYFARIKVGEETTMRTFIVAKE